jgi:hypothetical protein
MGCPMLFHCAGSPADYTHWLPGQPGPLGDHLDCACMDLALGGVWDDYHCEDVWYGHKRHSFACEYRKYCVYVCVFVRACVRVCVCVHVCVCVKLLFTLLKKCQGPFCVSITAVEAGVQQVQFLSSNHCDVLSWCTQVLALIEIHVPVNGVDSQSFNVLLACFT